MTVNKIILLADMESFYASAEIASNPSLSGKPVVVCGDPGKRHGIVLAASKEAKIWGIKTGMLAGECKRLCPTAIFVRPHMKLYIDISIKITDILAQFTDRIFVYSIDEQFLDMTGCGKLFGTPYDMAASIINEILHTTGIRCRIGIGRNPLQAKMACDRFAKKGEEGIFELSHENYARYVWPLPIKHLFGVGSRMERNLYRMGIREIGHIARLPREKLKRHWGINGEVIWLNAHGLDYSIVQNSSAGDQKGVGNSITLPRDYRDIKEIETVLLELTEETCRRARSLCKMGRVVHLHCSGADFSFPSGFSRQKKLPDPTASTMDIYPVLRELFKVNWDQRAIRSMGVGISQLIDDNFTQLSFFEDKDKKMRMGYAMDAIRERFGAKGLFRLSSLTSGGQLFERSKKIGGHEA